MIRDTRSGILPVDKGPGVTSFQVVAQLRRVLRAPKIGHGGTLDPAATGLLPILIGEATKLTPYLVELDKEYLATVRLGVSTDTQDLSGVVLESRPVPELDAVAIGKALAPFVGRIRQVPPMYSAIHHEGRRLYELAREGVEVERQAREVTVHAIHLEAHALPDLVLRVSCGKGFYVRTLAADLGEALGTGGALARLVRTRVGPYLLENAVPWSVVLAAREGEALWMRMLPPDSALRAMPEARLSEQSARAFANGQSVTDPGAAGLVRVYGADGALLGLGIRRGALLKPERLLHADTPRPRVLPA
ncbi:MAG TPA: tRNA pseudouridine(55) synthase TruB [Candidatus Eisenbacteria bacterium]|nr:tRNA pseudouridine(55) synthase TruB [Candidatus Eisenbacteria bacterium]